MVADSHLHSKSLSTTLSLNNNFLRVDSAILEDSQHSRSQVQWRYARANAGFHCLENNRSSDRLARAAKWRSALRPISTSFAIRKSHAIFCFKFACERSHCEFDQFASFDFLANLRMRTMKPANQRPEIHSNTM